VGKLRNIVRESGPGVVYRHYKSRAHASQNRKRLEKIKILQAHGSSFNVEGIDIFIKDSIESGAYESCEIAACRENLRPEDVVLEIGAAIGYVGLFCRRHLGIQRYTSVECNPETLERLKGNYALNGFEPDTRNVALAQADGDIDFHVGPMFWADSALVAGESSRKLTVPGRTLESILKTLPAEPTALVLDVEGAESLLVDTIFPKSLRVLVVEMHPNFIGMPKTCALTTRWIQQGFALTDIKGQVYVFARETDSATQAPK
jgi:FkbM family methyltransferase